MGASGSSGHSPHLPAGIADHQHHPPAIGISYGKPQTGFEAPGATPQANEAPSSGARSKEEKEAEIDTDIAQQLPVGRGCRRRMAGRHHLQRLRRKERATAEHESAQPQHKEDRPVAVVDQEQVDQKE